MRLAELTAPARRLALVGLAKNTGKTETLGAILRELQARRARVGVTSIGRDGEARDVIDSRIEKPRVHLGGGSLVASTAPLLRASGLPYELLERTGARTPLGEVQVARLQASGAVEVAGPSASADVRAVSQTMLAHGAERVLIDGAIDRRAASSPELADGLVIATGAVLAGTLEEVLARTLAAVELVRLPLADEADADGASAISLPAGDVLRADAAQLARLLGEHADAGEVRVEGALPEGFLQALLAAARASGRTLAVVAADPTRVFLSERAPSWYSRQGLDIRVRARTPLLALTVNPVAPRSHALDSRRLRAALADALPGVPVLDVLDAAYARA